MNDGDLLAPVQAGDSNGLGVTSVGSGAGESSREAMRGDLHEMDLWDITEDSDYSANMDAPGDIHQRKGLGDGSWENDTQALEAVTLVTNEAGSSSRVPEGGAMAEGRPRRVCQMPARYLDILPRPPPAVTPLQPGNDLEAPCGSGGPAHDVPPLVHVHLRAQDQLETTPDIFGVFRKYFDCPTYDLDGELMLDDLAGLTLPNYTLTTGAGSDTGWKGPEDMRHAPEVAYGPFPNVSTFMLSNWYYDSPSGERSDPDFN
ncbi:hypothetical protein JB92DRAFT_3117041 [Gautieria morchelliformis]|nr:hypothetical protein JB92DRAFT_3117041 [Gautieria morchelliformis]